MFPPSIPVPPPPVSGPPSLSGSPPLSGASRSGSGRRRRRVRDRRQLCGHQDDVATGGRGGAHCGGDAWARGGGEEEDRGEVMRQEAGVLTGLPRMRPPERRRGFEGERRQTPVYSGLCPDEQAALCFL